jgi:hypothetical protein
VTASAVLSRLRAGVIVAGCVLLVSCGAFGRSAQPVLKVHDVVGTWSNHKGSTITFQADGSFSAAGMDMGPNLQGCSSVSGTGSWEFLSPQGDSPSSGVPYASGQLVDLSFDGQNDSCDATLTSWEIDPPVGLCLDFDPDSPCTGTPWTKEH